MTRGRAQDTGPAVAAAAAEVEEHVRRCELCRYESSREYCEARLALLQQLDLVAMGRL